MVARLDKRLKWSLRADSIFSTILIFLFPIGLYVAAPIYSKMYKVADSGGFIFNMRMAGLAFSLFFLLKLLVNLKAMSLSIKWLWASILLCLPSLFYAFYLLSGFREIPFDEWSPELFYVPFSYALIFSGTSLAVVVFGVQKVLKSEN